jgi:hypothetical protein
VEDRLIHHKDTKRTKKQKKVVGQGENRTIMPGFVLLCALCVFVVEILFQAATRNGTLSLRAVLRVSTGNAWFAGFSVRPIAPHGGRA